MTREFFDAIQKAKEIIGYFADGSGSEDANCAKSVWTLLDVLQEPHRTSTGYTGIGRQNEEDRGDLIDDGRSYGHSESYGERQ